MIRWRYATSAWTACATKAIGWSTWDFTVRPSEAECGTTARGKFPWWMLRISWYNSSSAWRHWSVMGTERRPFTFNSQLPLNRWPVTLINFFHCLMILLLAMWPLHCSASSSKMWYFVTTCCDFSKIYRYLIIVWDSFRNFPGHNCRVSCRSIRGCPTVTVTRPCTA